MRALVVLLLPVTLLACDGDGPEPPREQASLTITDGTVRISVPEVSGAWLNSGAENVGALIWMAGPRSGIPSLRFDLRGALGTGTYAVNGDSAAGLATGTLTRSVGDVIHLAEADSGTVTITEASSERMRGTFDVAFEDRRRFPPGGPNGGVEAPVRRVRAAGSFSILGNLPY